MNVKGRGENQMKWMLAFIPTITNGKHLMNADFTELLMKIASICVFFETSVTNNGLTTQAVVKLHTNLGRNLPYIMPYFQI